jgi:alkylhydroperoxidase family enzyme
MKPMYLREVEACDGDGERGELIRRMQAANVPVPQIQYLLAFKPERTDHLSRFTQAVMRGPSPLSPAQRELIAAFTSRLNQCPF